MNRKKTIKQLMSIGVQRNDAAAFARTYRKIKDANMHGLFPDIIEPVMPVMGTVVNYRVTPFRAECFTAESQRYCLREDKEVFATRIMHKLSENLAECLMENGAIIMRQEEIDGVGTRYTATVKVVMSEGE